MKIPRAKRKTFDLGESGTLSDLAFLLIIFFILIAVFNVHQGYLLGLPSPDSRRIVQKQDLLQVELDQKGNLYLAGENITLETLTQIARTQRQNQPNLTFALKIHPDTPYQRVVDIVSLVRKLDIDTFSFIMGEAQ